MIPSGTNGVFVGRVWDIEQAVSRPVLVCDEKLFDLSQKFKTVADLFDESSVISALNSEEWHELGPVQQLWKYDGENWEKNPGRYELLSPIDLQVIKACGVTFVESLLERVIEEKAGGDTVEASKIRDSILQRVGSHVNEVQPGSEKAKKLKEMLIEEGIWSQYLEVGIGPDPEVFTKAPVLSSVGSLAEIGIPSFSYWNNPEPELVLVVSPQGKIQGVTLGNDVNLRDVEGRSALLLGMAKDNNGSCAIGPFIRVFDEEYTIEDARNEEIILEVYGEDGFTLKGKNSVSKISRSLEELVQATYGSHHQYPDGFVLFTGTLFAPIQDRDYPGQGFTHKPNDIVKISSAHLGTLVNDVRRTEELDPWTFGIREFHQMLSRLG